MDSLTFHVHRSNLHFNYFNHFNSQSNFTLALRSHLRSFDLIRSILPRSAARSGRPRRSVVADDPAFGRLNLDQKESEQAVSDESK